jgi:hypothetical protein
MNMTLEFGILDGLFLVFARYARSHFFVRSIRLEEGGQGETSILIRPCRVFFSPFFFQPSDLIGLGGWGGG